MKKIELNVDSKVKTILSMTESKRVLEECLPELVSVLEKQTGVHGFTMRRVAEYTKGAISESQLQELDKRLRDLEIMVEDHLVSGGIYEESQPLTEAASEIKPEEPYHTIRPGQVWRDTEGKRIQAHGGAVFYESGTYYWYGENKDRTDGKCFVWTWGIRAYASTDLYNWTDLGLIIPPDLINNASGLYPEKHVDRPHIIKCQATGKYVCWIKQSGEEGCFLILTADSFAGPYTIVKENYKPFGMEVGDFDIEIDAESQRAYLYMDGDHVGIIGMVLTDDYQAVAAEVSRQYTGLHAPWCREGVTLFSHGDTHYMLTSGMSGYVPNKSDAAMTKDWKSPYVSIGDPHENDSTGASFNSQLSDVFRVEGTDLYISIADRWLPGYLMDGRKSEMFERAIAMHFEPEHYQITPEENEEYMDRPMLENVDTSVADYIWLPVMIENGKPVIRWYEEWRVEDFI